MYLNTLLNLALPLLLLDYKILVAKSQISFPQTDKIQNLLEFPQQIITFKKTFVSFLFQQFKSAKSYTNTFTVSQYNTVSVQSWLNNFIVILNPHITFKILVRIFAFL